VFTGFAVFDKSLKDLTRFSMGVVLQFVKQETTGINIMVLKRQKTLHLIKIT